MANEIDLALMSANVYDFRRLISNRVGIPDGWTRINYLEDDPSTGFSAGVFQRGNEIVIAYTGTNEVRDGLTNARLGTGFQYDAQLEQAADLYLRTRRLYGDNITLTGHSLGGGLAALVAVYFGVSAITFNSAPFRRSINDQFYARLETHLVRLIDEGAANASPAFRDLNIGDIQDRVLAVQNINTRGEILSVADGAWRITRRPEFYLEPGKVDASSTDLHSISLLAAFLHNEQFTALSRNLPQLLPVVFDTAYFGGDTRTAENVFIDHLVRYQFGVSSQSIAPIGVLDRFVDDFAKFAAVKPLTLEKNFTDAIIGIGLQHYLQQKTGSETFFKALAGGIQFDLTKALGDTETSLAEIKGYEALGLAVRDRMRGKTRLFEEVVSTFDSFAKEKRRWSINLGSGGMSGATTGDDTSDLVFGGEGAEYFESGAGDDLLIGLGGWDIFKGGSGKDKLFGGDGKDHLDAGEDDDSLDGADGVGDYLKGGAGFDKYFVRSSEGTDVIFDEDGKGSIKFDHTTLTGGKSKSKSKPGSPVTTWFDNPDNPLWQYDARAFKGNNDVNAGKVELVISNLKTGSTTFVEEFKNGDLGINLEDGDDKGRRQSPTPQKPATPPRNPGSAVRGDPLLIDLSGLGFSASATGVSPANGRAGTVGFDKNLHFDLDGDGFAEKTGWVNANAGVLMIDKAGNSINPDGSVNPTPDGALTDGQEIFGDLTRLNGGQLAANGFQALSQYDRNHDGIIDASDPVWASLKVARFETNPYWETLAPPGSPGGEVMFGDPGSAMSLVSLDDLGIKAIHLGSTLNAAPMADANGITQTRLGSIEMTDGSIRQIAEYRFKRDEGDTRFTQWRDETPDITALPELKLGGRVMDLHQALIRDADAAGYSAGNSAGNTAGAISHPQGTLRAALDAFLGASGPASGSGSGSSGTLPAQYPQTRYYANREAAFNNLFALWTGTDHIAESATAGAMNARHAAVLEKVYGGSYQNATYDQAVSWELTYRRLSETYYASLSAQSHFDSAYQAIDWQNNASIDQVIGHLHAVQGSFDARLALALGDEAATALVTAEINEFGRVLRGLGLTRETSYFAFREHYVTNPDGSFNEAAGFAFDAAGVPFSPTENGSFNAQNGFTQATLQTSGIPLYGSGGDDVLYDVQDTGRQLVGGPGDNVLYGGAGIDNLFSHEGDDILDGGSGDDRLNGDAGDDVFVFRIGSGHDVIRESGGNDTIFFGSNLTRDDLIVSRQPNGTLISISVTGDSILIPTPQFRGGAEEAPGGNGSGIACFTFGDASILNRDFYSIPDQENAKRTNY